MAFPLEKLQNRRVATSDVIQCAFDLGDHELRVYDALNDMGPSRAEDVAAAVGREPSVVYRNLQKLMGCDVVVRQKETLAEGGYFYLYRARPKREVKKKLAACIDDWYAQMRQAIDRL